MRSEPPFGPKPKRVIIKALLLAACLVAVAAAQVISPHVVRQGDVDTRDLHSLAASIIERAGARTPRERAEAIWRFFLTDGRFVKPGFWYHIAGWAYEEPHGEVLDPMKLVRSYGFGLCYQVAPLLSAVYDAAGFEHSRVWFLTGHTVAEVFYEGAYHLYDSDMMGYTVMGEADFRKLPVASVRQLERDPGLILRKLLSPTQARPGVVDSPWYPADLRAAAMNDVAEAYATSGDNYLYSSRRYPQGHTSDFVLRPGERMVLHSEPESPHLFYLPYKWDGAKWSEFPHELAGYHIRAEDGPQSQKDARRWGTGRLEYCPQLSFDRLGRAVVQVNSPYVIIDAAFTLRPFLKGPGDKVTMETSTDGGRSWEPAGSIAGPHETSWNTEPRLLVKSEHGRHTAVSGGYGYLVRIGLHGGARIAEFQALTRFQFNPRTLPDLQPGRNPMHYRGEPPVRRDVIPVALNRAAGKNAHWFVEDGQGFMLPVSKGPAEFVFEVTAPGGAPLSGVDVGGRFLNLQGGLAPDKLNAEVRRTAARLPSGGPAANIEWALSRKGPYRPLWSFDPRPRWRDRDIIPQLLLWPEVDKQIRRLSPGTRKVYVRYRFSGLAVDDVRLTALSPAPQSSSLEITHAWIEAGRERTHVERVAQPALDHTYNVDAGTGITRQSLTYYCPKRKDK